MTRTQLDLDLRKNKTHHCYSYKACYDSQETASLIIYRRTDCGI